jgi:glycosyltransferase involved in cell wall biosynthesis
MLRSDPIHLIHHTFNRGGGMERYALTLAASLKELGHTVLFHARRTNPDLARARGIELDTVPVQKFPRKLREFRFFRAMERRRRDWSGVQIALNRVRATDAVTCGGTHRGYLRNARKIAGPFDWLECWMERQAYHCARVVIAHSDLCREELVRWYQVPAAKIVTLYPPIDEVFGPPASQARRQEARRRLGLPDSGVILLFPSMGHRRKGLKPLCQALASFNDEVVLAVVGKPSSITWPFVRELGYLEDMATAYQAADFTILASFYEPFGLVGPESLLCGTRLIFEERIGCLAAVKPEYAFTFSVRNAESIRGAVRQALRLAQAVQHRIERPNEALRYDPRPAKHAAGVLEAALARPAGHG